MDGITLTNKPTVTNVLHNVLLVPVLLVTVPPVKLVEFNNFQTVHVQVDKLILMEFVITVVTDVLNVQIPPLIVILVTIPLTDS
jgi:hypothetical protein